MLILDFLARGIQAARLTKVSLTFLTKVLLGKTLSAGQHGSVPCTILQISQSRRLLYERDSIVIRQTEAGEIKDETMTGQVLHVFASL